MTTEIKPTVTLWAPDRTPPYIIRCAIKCPDGTILCTKHRHDYQTHLDTVTGEVYVIDGGHGYYYRTSVNKVPAESLMVTTDDPFEEQRKVPFWKSYGKNGEYPDGIILSLGQMEDEHLCAIIETQIHIKGTAVEQMFINEIEWRKDHG